MSHASETRRRRRHKKKRRKETNEGKKRVCERIRYSEKLKGKVGSVKKKDIKVCKTKRENKTRPYVKESKRYREGTSYKEHCELCRVEDVNEKNEETEDDQRNLHCLPKGKKSRQEEMAEKESSPRSCPFRSCVLCLCPLVSSHSVFFFFEPVRQE